MFDLKLAFYALDGRLYFDGRYKDDMTQSELNRAIACVEDNFDGKKIDYDGAVSDFEKG